VAPVLAEVVIIRRSRLEAVSDAQVALGPLDVVEPVVVAFQNHAGAARVGLVVGPVLRQTKTATFKTQMPISSSGT
ncbi:hypothetical protein LPJ57_010916, partial [Coemansia sp. RSA 486]